MKFTWYSYSYVYFLILHHLTSATIRAVHGFENQEAEESAENGVELFFVSEDDNETKQGSGTGDLADSSSTRSADNGKMKMTPHHRDMEKWFSSTKGARNEALTEHMVNSVWGLHKRWHSIALKRKRAYNFFQRFAVFLISSGAMLQTLSHQLYAPYEWISSLAAGACLGIAPFVTQHFLSHDKMTDWIVSRATSEALKAEVFKFRSGVKPYHRDNSVEVLAMHVTSILEPSADFDTYDRMNMHNILWSLDGNTNFPNNKSNNSNNSKNNNYSNSMNSKNRNRNSKCRDFSTRIDTNPPPSLKHSKESYIEWRLKPQVECYFRKDARKLKRISIVVKTIQNTLAAASSSIAFVAARSRFLASGKDGPTTWLNAKLSNIGVWGAVMTTVAAAIGTQFATSKFDEIGTEFRNAANDIERKVLIMSSKNLQTGSPEWETFILECEGIIAATNKSSKAMKQKGRREEDLKIDAASLKKKWNPDVQCKGEDSASFSAASHAEWLIEHKDYTMEGAQQRVMEEFPDAFQTL